MIMPANAFEWFLFLLITIPSLMGIIALTPFIVGFFFEVFGVLLSDLWAWITGRGKEKDR